MEQGWKGVGPREEGVGDGGHYQAAYEQFRILRFHTKLTPNSLQFGSGLLRWGTLQLHRGLFRNGPKASPQKVSCRLRSQ